MTIAVLGVDLSKNSCSLVGLDAAGRVVLRRRMRRETVNALGAKLPGCVVVKGGPIPGHGRRAG
jgi:transposase